MSKKSNEEKLKILQERLATIKENQEKKIESKKQESKEPKKIIEKEPSNIHNNKSEKSNRQFKVLNFLLLLILLSSLSIFGYYFIQNNMEIEAAINNIKEDISYLSKIGEDNKKDIKSNPNDVLNIDTSNEIEFKIKYNKNTNNRFEGFIIVLNSYSIKDSSLAIKEIEKYKNEYTVDARLNCNKFFLPDVSSSEKEIIQTYLGPFETKAEAKQYLESPASIKGDIYKLQ